MKKVGSALLFSVSLFLAVPGCGGSGGGAVTDNAEKSAVEQYEANLADSQADLEAAGAEVESDE